MHLQELFDSLLVERKITVCASKKKAENMRVQLAKKWSKYRKELDSFGFLSKEMAACSLCKIKLHKSEENSDAFIWEFSLRVKDKVQMDYSVVEPMENNNAAV